MLETCTVICKTHCILEIVLFYYFWILKYAFQICKINCQIFNGSSITHKDDHFANKLLKIG